MTTNTTNATETILDTMQPNVFPARPSRDEAIERIKKALRARSGKAWSVRGGRGTSWGWIEISAPPKRQNEFGYMTTEDQAELGRLLGLDRPAHLQGVSVPASGKHRQEYVDRAEGREPSVIGEQYWD